MMDVEEAQRKLEELNKKYHKKVIIIKIVLITINLILIIYGIVKLIGLFI